jgi:hypothetical protein
MTWLLDDRTATWARDLIRAGREHGPLPVYGSDEWWELEAGNPRRLAAILVASEGRRHYLHPDVIAEDLREQMRQADLEIAARVRTASWDVSAAWTLPTQPTQVELERRRTDYDGGTWARERGAA